MTSEDELGQRTQEIRAAVASLRSEVDRLHAQLGGVPSEPAVEDLEVRRAQPESAPEGGDETPEAEAPPSAVPTPEAEVPASASPTPEAEVPASASPTQAERDRTDEAVRDASAETAEPVVERGRDSTDTGPETTDAGEASPAAVAVAGAEPEEEPAAADVQGGAEAEVVPERLAAKSDAELAKTYDLACALLEDAESRRDQQAIGHWRSLAAAALEESVRRPDFGEAEGASRRRLAGRRSRRLIAQLESARQLHLDRTS